MARASYKAASLDATHSPRRLKTFCGAIAGIPRICAPDLSAGEPRGRLLREIGACEDFEIRCVVCTVSLDFGLCRSLPFLSWPRWSCTGCEGGYRAMLAWPGADLRTYGRKGGASIDVRMALEMIVPPPPPQCFCFCFSWPSAALSPSFFAETGVG